MVIRTLHSNHQIPPSVNTFHPSLPTTQPPSDPAPNLPSHQPPIPPTSQPPNHPTPAPSLTASQPHSPQPHSPQPPNVLISQPPTSQPTASQPPNPPNPTSQPPNSQPPSTPTFQPPLYKYMRHLYDLPSTVVKRLFSSLHVVTETISGRLHNSTNGFNKVARIRGGGE